MPRKLIALLLVIPPAVAGAEDDDALRRALLELATTRENARAFLVDDKRYPVPAKASAGWRVGVDRQPGHRDMEALVCAAIVKHNAATTALAKRLGLRTRVVGNKKPTTAPLEITRAVNHYGIVVVDRGIEPFLKKRSKGERKPEAGLDAAILALAQERWKDAREAGAKLKDGDAVTWETLRAARVLAWNERNRAKHGREEADGMRLLNAYRVALGYPPLILDSKLHYMARDFAVAMANGRFLSHQHPTDPARRTLAHRARRARYKGRAGENVSSEGDGEKAVWRWRADAGHHRMLVTTLFRAAGLGCTKVSVLNLGDTTTATIVELYAP